MTGTLERIAQIRRQIAAGTYETTEKLSLALDVFLKHKAAWPGSPGSAGKKISFLTRTQGTKLPITGAVRKRYKREQASRQVFRRRCLIIA